MNRIKSGLRKLVKVVGGLACVIIGLHIAGFGFSQLMPEKKTKKKKGGCKK